MAQNPLGFGHWSQALTYALSKPREIAIVGDPDSADTQALLSVVRDGYRPLQVVAERAPDRDTAAPLLGNRAQLEGQARYPEPAACVCRDLTCQARLRCRRDCGRS